MAGLGLIVGLGNPGAEHARTRHNAGFWFVDALAEQAGVRFGLESKLFGETAKIEIGGQPALQQAVRWNLFQLIQAAARAEGTGVPAKGVTGSGYDGHYFWDTEISVLPFLTYTSPHFARNALRFRHTLLDAAPPRAVELNQLAPLYPWRTINREAA